MLVVMCGLRLGNSVDQVQSKILRSFALHEPRRQVEHERDRVSVDGVCACSWRCDCAASCQNLNISQLMFLLKVCTPSRPNETWNVETDGSRDTNVSPVTTRNPVAGSEYLHLW